MSNSTQKKNHLQLIFMLLLMAAIVTAIVMYYGVIKRQPSLSVANVKIDGVFLSTAKDIADFQLTDNAGKPFSKNNLKGQWTMLFFGFTNCGYVCPTTMTELNQMYRILQKELPDKKLPQIVLISVDPERDSVQKMNEYINAYNSHFIGARAEEAEIQMLARQLHISAIKMQPEGEEGDDHYMINHTAEILLFNPEAKIQAYLSYPHKADQMVKDYKLILKVTAS